jgi:hypothetical protein
MMPLRTAKETTAMHYKTIVMELIDDQPELAVRLRGSKQMLATVETYAMELKAIHEAWKAHLAQTKPGSDPIQITSEALELAIEEIRDRLPSALAMDEEGTPSLDAAMTSIRRPSRPE